MLLLHRHGNWPGAMYHFVTCQGFVSLIGMPSFLCLEDWSDALKTFTTSQDSVSPLTCHHSFVLEIEQVSWIFWLLPMVLFLHWHAIIPLSWRLSRCHKTFGYFPGFCFSIDMPSFLCLGDWPGVINILATSQGSVSPLTCHHSFVLEIEQVS